MIGTKAGRYEDEKRRNHWAAYNIYCSDLR